MLAILIRNTFVVAGGRRSPGTFLLLPHHESISKPFSTSPSLPNSDLAASFFKTSCGLSPSAALASASKISMKTTENAESVLRLLETYGFTKPNIALIAAKLPAFFNSNPEKCIKPKLDLFIAAGFTGDFIVKIFSQDPGILKQSLARKLSPNLHLLINILGGDRDAVATTIIRFTWIFNHDLNKHMLLNMETLRQHGGGANIPKLFRWCPRAVTQEPKQFSKHLALLKDMGFNPSNAMFVQGIKVTSGLTRPSWERKLRLYRSVGWSREETLSAFKKSPSCMGISEEKVRKIIAFFVENLKWEPSRLAMTPIILSYSFEKRIVPRYDVFNILSMSGLAGTNLSFSSIIYMSESNFLKYLCKFTDTFPKLLEDYKVKLGMAMAVPSNFVL